MTMNKAEIYSVVESQSKNWEKRVWDYYVKKEYMPGREKEPSSDYIYNNGYY